MGHVGGSGGDEMNLASNTFKLLSAVIRINLVMLSVGESVNTIIIISFEVWFSISS